MSFQYAWSAPSGTGGVAGASYTLIPLYAVRSLLEFIGIGYSSIQMLTFIGIFFLSMLGMFLFVQNIFMKAENRNLIALMAAIFYVFNPISMLIFFSNMNLSIFIFSFTPILLYLIKKSTESTKLIDAEKIIVFFFVFTVIWFNPAWSLPIIFLCTPYILFLLVTGKKTVRERIRALRFWVISFALLFLTNLWWILPFSGSLQKNYIGAATILPLLDTLKMVSTNFVRLTDFFRVLPYTFDPNLFSYKQDWWFPLYYNNIFFLTIGASLFILFLVPLLSKKVGHKKEIFFFSFILIISIFLMKGLHPPLGQIYLFLFEKIPYFDIFRNPYNKFAILFVVSASVLFALSLNQIYSLLKKHVKRNKAFIAIVCLIIIFNGVYAFPLWNGNIINDPIKIRGNTISSEVQIPSYYQDASKWFNEQGGDYRILALPLRPYFYVGFNWTYGYDSGDDTALLLNHDTISNLNYNLTESDELLALAEGDGYQTLFSLLPLFNIKYVVVQTDVDPVHGNYGPGVTLDNPQSIKTMLDNSADFKFVTSFGKLYIYEPNYYLPHIYAASASVLVNGSLTNMVQLINTNSFTIGNSPLSSNGISDSNVIENPSFILSDQLNPNQQSLLSEKTSNSPIYLGPSNFTITNGFIVNENASSLSLSQPTYIDNTFSVGWTPFDAQGATAVWSPAKDNLTFVIDSPDAGSHLVAYTQTNLSVDIKESPYVTARAKTTNATLFLGFQVENSTGHVWNLMASGLSPLSGFNVQNSGWVSETANIYTWAESMGAEDASGNLTVTGISYFVYNNEAEGVSSTYMNYIAFGKFAGSSPYSGQATATLNIPESGNYTVAIRTAAGQDYGKFDITVNGQESIIDSSSRNLEPTLTYQYITPIYLPQGNCSILINSNQTVEITDLLVYPVNANGGHSVNDWLTTQQNNVTLDYTKINPTQYIVSVNTSQPFFLVFSESFDKGWVATINGQQVPSNYHFTINGYANGWYINKTGTFTITLEFPSQNLFYLGSVISIITFVLVAIYGARRQNQNGRLSKKFTERKIATPLLLSAL